jgi:hypothetical protein
MTAMPCRQGKKTSLKHAAILLKFGLRKMSFTKQSNGSTLEPTTFGSRAVLMDIAFWPDKEERGRCFVRKISFVGLDPFFAVCNFRSQRQKTDQIFSFF